MHDLDEIAAYLANESETLAKRVINNLEGFCFVLGIMPELGRPSEIVGVRKLVTTRYRYKIIYEIRTAKKEVVILRVYHSTRKMQY
ncbi:type II toxin-antitoxin system RelE/ParE family toxin [Candidatus Kaiserbacteria bacterium]|nr:type II toxin-antitoxin system RelE/ParE family toxin [Candidatus Kaiserbacteria bacterium]